MVSMDVSDLQTRADLARFLGELVRSLEEEPDSWANASLYDFLEALAAWVEDMDGYYANRGEDDPIEPTWRLVGEMFLAARVYE